MEPIKTKPDLAILGVHSSMRRTVLKKSLCYIDIITTIPPHKERKKRESRTGWQIKKLTNLLQGQTTAEELRHA
ncbi:FAD linked oxidase, C-domain-containing protein [Anopheles sinensis]|uniref:FAD linked oxidase, C-domain-containing protein n=1 Tax=Anopheles sinensis TaxID=74873 RepID=A0A084VH71_ANOSI|nr:FAD linked oxidase, C-domain-containing protein [Anopheles sinensis]